MTNRTTPIPQTQVPISLVPQTGMPTLHTSRSAELNYDALQGNPRFIKNPYGPTKLSLSRSNYRW